MVRGPTAAASGEAADNLVIKAARALAGRVDGLKLGRFLLTKSLPVAAGLGGGSADAAAALRLLAHAGKISKDDPRLMAAARATGADVPVCLDPRPRVMRGIGEVLSDALDLPRLPAVLVNPGVAVPTKDVFAALRLEAEANRNTNTSFGSTSKTELIEAIAQGRNDLEAPAIAIQPEIADVLRCLRRLDGCRLARMSGSGRSEERRVGTEGERGSSER